MLKLFNSYGKKLQSFIPVKQDGVGIFTCGPSVYQRSHIGNFRTFLFEDILVRYLEYSGHRVRRGMNFTDMEDKAIEEAAREKTNLKRLTQKNISLFMREMKLLRIKTPDYLPKASECVKEAVQIIERLLELGIAYRNEGDIYFDPLKVPGFGSLYGLDMSRWPKEKRRFHKDTYPGNRWNLGDFILWHGFSPGDNEFTETPIGKGRPSWNIQDPAMVSKYFQETLSVYCGGIDNLFRHHDYSKAILEAVRPYPMARFWLHCHHLYIDGKKMSKSRGNIFYTDTVMKKGYGADELRFFLIYGHYRKVLDYCDESMEASAEELKGFRRLVARVRERAGRSAPGREDKGLRNAFVRHMDNDLDLAKAFDEVHQILSKINVADLRPAEAAGMIESLKAIDDVLKVIF